MAKLAEAWSDARLNLKTLDADGKKAEAKLKRMVTDWESDLAVNIAVNLDDSNVGAQLRELSSQIERAVTKIEADKIQLDVDLNDSTLTAAAEAAHRKVEEALDDVTQDVNLDLDQFNAEWAELQATLLALSDQIDVTVDVDVDGIAAAEGQIAAMKAQLDALLDRAVTLDVDVDDDAVFEDIALLERLLANRTGVKLPIKPDMDIDALADDFGERFRDVQVGVEIPDALATKEAIKARKIIDRVLRRIPATVYVETDQAALGKLKTSIADLGKLLKGTDGGGIDFKLDRSLGKDAIDQTLGRIREMRLAVRDQIDLSVGMDPISMLRLKEYERTLKRLNDRAILTRVRVQASDALANLLKLTSLREGLRRTITEMRVRVSGDSIAKRTLGGLQKARDALGVVGVKFIMNGQAGVRAMLDRLADIRAAYNRNPIVVAVRERGLRAALLLSQKLEAVKKRLSSVTELGFKDGALKAVGTAMAAIDAIRTRLGRGGISLNFRERGARAVRTTMLGLDALRTRFITPAIATFRERGLGRIVAGVRSVGRAFSGMVSSAASGLGRLFDGRQGFLGRLRTQLSSIASGIGRSLISGFAGAGRLGRSAFSGFLRAGLSVASSIGEAFSSTWSAVTEGLSGAFATVREVGGALAGVLAENLNPAAIAKTLGMVAVIGTAILGIVGAVTVAAGGAVAAIGALIGAAAALAAGAVTALAAVGGLSIAAILFDDEAKQFAVDQLTTLKFLIADAFDPIKGLLLNDVLPAFLGVAAEVIDASAGVAEALIIPLSESLLTLFDRLTPLIAEITGPMAQGLASIIDTISKFAPTFGDISLTVGPGVTDSINALLELVFLLGDAFKEDIGATFQAIADSLRIVAPDLVSMAGLLEPTFNLLLSIFEVIVQVAAEVGPAFEDVFNDLSDDTETWVAILTFGARVAVGMARAFDMAVGGFRTLMNVIGSIVKLIAGGLSGILKGLKFAVDGIISGLNRIPGVNIPEIDLGIDAAIIGLDGLGVGIDLYKERLNGANDESRSSRAEAARLRSGIAELDRNFANGRLSLSEYADAGREATGMLAEFGEELSVAQVRAQQATDEWNAFITSLSTTSENAMEGIGLGDAFDRLVNEDIPKLSEFLDEENTSITGALLRRNEEIAKGVRASKYIMELEAAGFDSLALVLGDLTPAQVFTAMEEIGSAAGAGARRWNEIAAEGIRASTPSIDAAIEERGRFITAALERTNRTIETSKVWPSLAEHMRTLSPEAYGAFVAELDSYGAGALAKAAEWDEKLRLQNEGAARIATEQARKGVADALAAAESAYQNQTAKDISTVVGATVNLLDRITGATAAGAAEGTAYAGGFNSTSTPEPPDLSGLNTPEVSAQVAAAGESMGASLSTAITTSIGTAAAGLSTVGFASATAFANGFVAGSALAFIILFPAVLSLIESLAAANPVWYTQGSTGADQFVDGIVTGIALQQARLVGIFTGLATMLGTFFMATMLNTLAPLGLGLQGVFNGALLGLAGIAQIQGVGIGNAIANGIITGMLMMMPMVTIAAQQIGNAAAVGARAALGINSPSLVMQQVGRNVVDGLAIGILSNMGSVRTAAEQLAIAATTGNGAGMRGSFNASGALAAQGFADGMTATSAAMDAAARLSSTVVGVVRGQLQIASPSKVMEALGRNVAEGLAAGISSNVGLVAGASAGMAAAIPGAVSMAQREAMREVYAPVSNTSTTTVDSRDMSTTNLYGADPYEMAGELARKKRDRAHLGRRK